MCYVSEFVLQCLEESFLKYQLEIIDDIGRNFLDERIPLLQTSWKEISSIQVEENKLVFYLGSKKIT